jgi:hypothetical protein
MTQLKLKIAIQQNYLSLNFKKQFKLSNLSNKVNLVINCIFSNKVIINCIFKQVILFIFPVLFL